MKQALKGEGFNLQTLQTVKIPQANKGNKRNTQMPAKKQDPTQEFKAVGPSFQLRPSSKVSKRI